MEIALLSDILGTPRHLVHDGKKFTWSSTIPESAWVYPGKHGFKGLLSVIEALGAEILDFQTNPHAIAWKSILGERDAKIPWVHALPADQFQKIVTKLLDQLWMLLDQENDGYYMNEFVVNRRLLESLSAPVVDEKKIDNFLSDSTSKSKSDLLKFVPDSSGRAAPSVYTQNNTVTGRVTITSGPNILTLKKKYRQVISSEFAGGKIVQVDIVSLEPRIALLTAGKSAPVDIYTEIQKTVLDSTVSRSQAKISTLGCIYGMSPWTLSKKLPDSLNARDIMMKIRDYFDIPYLENRLKKEFKAHGFIRNAYGRKIFEDTALVNHYLQSSGADASLLAFSNLKKSLEEQSVKFKAVYVIHDAILLDVGRDAISSLKDTTKDGIDVPSFNQKFPITIENITGDKIE
jgi:hypothetical protein